MQRALGRRLGPRGAERREHANRQRTLSREGLARLLQIATLIMVGAVLAMAAAMGTMLWQRRPRLAKLKLEGFSRGELWRMVLLEKHPDCWVSAVSPAPCSASTVSNCSIGRSRT